MLRFLADENFNGQVVRGLLRRDRSFRIVRTQDLGLTGLSDSALLEYAASQGLILVTHDVQTLVAEAYKRTIAGQAMPGVIEAKRTLSVSDVIEDLLLIGHCGSEADLRDQVIYLPL